MSTQNNGYIRIRIKTKGIDMKESSYDLYINSHFYYRLFQANSRSKTRSILAFGAKERAEGEKKRQRKRLRLIKTVRARATSKKL
jgi:hypothetical protein